MIKFVVPCLAIALIWMPNNAWAQANLPEFNVINIEELDLSTGQSDDLTHKDRIMDINNQSMRSNLLLQNDITMLNALTAWQEQVSELEGTYRSAGLNFKPPKPPRHICDQVPSNSLCENAYPELAPQIEIETVTQPVSPTTPTAPSTRSIRQAPEAPKIIRAENYEWDRISCIQDNCRAVLLDKEQNLRFSVEQGEILEPGVTIASIDASGITIREGGENYDLRSATSDNSGSNAIPSPTPSLTDQLSTLPVSALDSLTPVEPIVLDAGEPEPPVGATGLF